MKSKILIYALPLVMLMAASGCKKSFLDAEPSEKLSPEQLKEAAAKDPSLLNVYVTGLYSAMYNTGTGGTTGHDDFGQKGYDIYSDMLCSDMVLGAVNYGWYRTIAAYTAPVDYTTNPCYIPWRYYYQIIYAANTVIDAFGGTNAVPTGNQQKYIVGQAKAMRAYAYFYLSQLYAKDGYGTGTEKTIPIYDGVATANRSKGTSAQVYDLMIKDLTEAITYLDSFNRTSKGQINKYVAKGLLAYVYAARGTQADLQQVVTLTADIIANSSYRLNTSDEVVAKLDPVTGALLNPQAGFNNLSNESWLWGADITLSSNLDLISWWGQVDLFTYSYAWAGDPKLIDKGLYTKMQQHPDDVRLNQFDADLWPTGKFFNQSREEGGQRTITDDYVYMRMEEMYLLNAEANAKLTQDVAARTSLKGLLSKRMTNYAYVDALSGQALQDEIYLQTRVELWGEGKSYLAMKRNKATITRGANHLFFAGNSFAYNDPKLTLSIPQAEVLNNANLNK